LKLALISTYNRLYATGLRWISAYLKANGHSVKMVFLPSSRKQRQLPDYAPAALDALADVCKDVDLIGLSLMANSFVKAAFVTRELKRRLSVPIMWGGIYPTVVPESSLEHVDLLCVGEGEEVLLDVASRHDQGRGFDDVPNLWLKKGSQLITNPPRPLEENLDKYPFPDYDLEGHYALFEKRLLPVDMDILRDEISRYMFLTSRGCPYACTFCCNHRLRDIYRGKGRYVRKRSVENVIAELEAMKQRFPFIEDTVAADDTFFVRSDEEFALFCRLYRERIGLPLKTETHPLTVTEPKIRMLVDAGMTRIEVGAQSASQRTLYDIYERRTPIEAIERAIQVLNQFKRQLTPQFDYIVSNPFEPKENLIETIRFVATRHLLPFKLGIFPLTLYPGTVLYQKAKESGIPLDEEREVYGRTFGGTAKFRDFDYLSLLLSFVCWMKQARMPQALVNVVVPVAASKPAVAVLDARWFSCLAWLVARGYRNLIYRPFIKPLERMRERRRFEQACAPGGG